MHADVIIVGSRCEAYLLGYLFAKRGLRTLLLAPDKGEARQGRFIFLDRDLAARFRPANPPDEAIRAQQVTVDMWAPGERRHVTVRQLPYYILEEGVYRRYLEIQSTRTRNLRVLKGHAPTGVTLSRDKVSGVTLATGDAINARLVVECDSGPTSLQRHLAALWEFPLLAPYRGQFFSLKRRVEASAWEMGTINLRLTPGLETRWNYRYSPDDLDVSAFMPPGVKKNPRPVVGRVYRETGLEEAQVVGQDEFEPHVGPPLPVPCAPGYLAAGLAAGQGNPFLPLDQTAVFAGAHQAFLSGAGALEEADVSMNALWEYARAHATDWGARQAFGHALARGIRELDAKRLDWLFDTGLFDTYALSCLVRNQPLDEDFLDRSHRVLRGLLRPSTLAAWTAAVRHGRRLAAVYRNAPVRYERTEARKWQAAALGAW